MLRRVSILCCALIAAFPVPRAHAQPPSTAKPVASGAQGKIILIQGHVDAAPAANQEKWDPATLFQPLFVSDRVRTLTASRSALLFIDETQVKLNAGAVLTVQQIKTGSGTATTLGLLQGEGWFRTKNPASGLTIKTPRAAAAIRGTEINLAVRGNDAVLTVTEGVAELSNDAGAILVNAGEEGTATPGQPPTKRTLLNPEDAVQWVLYYPTRVAWHDLPAAAQAAPARAGFDRLKAGDARGALAAFQPTVATDPWSRIGAAWAYEQLGDPAQARAVLGTGALSGDAEIERRAAVAAAALATGDARAARTELEAAIAANPNALRPLVMLSELELTQNHKAEAARLARRAIEAHPDSVAAHVAAAEAAQADFDLTTARRELDRAVAIDPTDVRALVDRARIRFGVGDTNGARGDADRAAAVAPADAQLRSLRGFIQLAAGNDAAARADFDAAVGADAALGEPHLGLGLLNFRAALYDEGLLEMLTATLLEPQVSLYQSYLGKAYYQLKRFPEGLAALASAKRLDPRDPTPWLYTSFFLRDQNRQVDALRDLRQAIALNDNRAVYRSRLLLDRDLATKNVSLAQLYNQLGFDAWGAYEALNSLNSDMTNASAHLFMGDTYSNLPDRSQALSSELEQYFLYSPVNLNSFNNFSEYTALLEQPLNQVLVTQRGGSPRLGQTVVTSRSGNERFAHAAFIDFKRLDSPRLVGADNRAQGFIQTKVSFGPSTDVFLSATAVTKTHGEDPDVPRLVGEFPKQIIVDELKPAIDPRITMLDEVAELEVGFKHAWRPGSSLTAAADVDYSGSTKDDSNDTFSTCIGFELAEQYHSSWRHRQMLRSNQLQLQQATRIGRHQVLVGVDRFRRRSTFDCTESAFTSDGQFAGDDDDHTRSRDRETGVYVRDDIEVFRNLHATVGARYVKGFNGDLNRQPDLPFARWNPYAGLSVRLSRQTVVHAAVLRNTNSNFLSSRIAPLTVAGFLLERNELPSTRRDEADAAVQNAWSRSFVEVRGFVRRSLAPLFTRAPVGSEEFAEHFAGLTPDADLKTTGGSVYFNQILTRRLTLFAENQFEYRRARLLHRRDNAVRVGVSFIDPHGFSARVNTRYFTQRFSDTTIVGLADSSTPLTDLELGYEFARKQGRATVSITNLFDRRFRTILEQLTVEAPLPERRVTVSLRWRL